MEVGENLEDARTAAWKIPDIMYLSTRTMEVFFVQHEVNGTEGTKALWAAASALANSTFLPPGVQGKQLRFNRIGGTANKYLR